VRITASLRYQHSGCCIVKYTLSYYWLAKTTETFKLSDLQYLEAKLQATSYECERLVLDAATGSSLFRLCGYRLHDIFKKNKLPSSLRRCKWIAEELLKILRKDAWFEEHEWDTNAAWTLEYMRMDDIDDRKKPTEYTSKSLLNCVAQAIQIPAALNPATATDRLQIVDTGRDLFLIRLLLQTHVPSHSIIGKEWKQRPFPYSSAINPAVADIVTALVFDLVEQYTGKTARISSLDPTCGSGTFLAFALARGATAQGWDTNPACMDGAIHLWQRKKQML
jgi:hypothetical protein